MNKTNRTFIYNEANDKFELTVDTKTEIKNGDVVAGTQKQHMQQVWDPEQIEILIGQISGQEEQVTGALNKTKTEIKEIGTITKRERDILRKRKEEMEKIQKLAKLEKLEEQEKSQTSMLEAIKKDKKELQDAVAKRPKSD